MNHASKRRSHKVFVHGGHARIYFSELGISHLSEEPSIDIFCSGGRIAYTERRKKSGFDIVLLSKNEKRRESGEVRWSFR